MMCEGSRQRGQGRQYLVDWEGYSPEDHLGSVHLRSATRRRPLGGSDVRLWSCVQVAVNKTLLQIYPPWFWLYLVGCQQTCLLETPLWFSLLLNGKYFSEFTSVQGPLWIHKIRLQDRSSLYLPYLFTLQRYSPSGGICSHSTLACQPQSPWLAHFSSEPTHSYTSPTHADVRGVVGQNISLQFTFNSSIRNDSRIAVYKCTDKEQKISEYPNYKNVFEIYPENSSIRFHLINLSLNHTEIYWATLFKNLKSKNSEKVQLTVQEENRSTSVPPVLSTFTKTANSGTSSFFSSRVLTVIVVSPFLLLAALLSFLVICLVKAKDQTQERPQRASNPTIEETVEVSVNTAGPSLVYSVLDFSKRPPSALGVSQNDTEYATVSYLPEKKPRPHTNK
ncbi:hypothetical protein CRENBAI_000925 [Crenichthys baileyi]|uniref:Uncharacterized protein n=1 Tax=Crenichthys baileyi TaxID=28760 RepID=A0AAV9RC97_9TELE